MVKSRGGRLSLTSPGPASKQSDSVGPEYLRDMMKPQRPTEAEAAYRRTGSDSAPTAQRSRQDRYRSRSSSPVTASREVHEHSNSFTSPPSPSLTSLPPFPASPTVPSRHAREQSRSFFANLKASKSSVKIQPVDPTIRKVQHDTGQGDEGSKKLARTKSTPDLRGVAVNESVPDLPSLDSSSTNVSVGQAAVHKVSRRPVGPPVPTVNVSQSRTVRGENAGPGSPVPENHDSRRNQRLFHNFMRRNHSNKSEDAISSKPGTPIVSKASDTFNSKPPSRDHSTGRNPQSNVDSDDFGEAKVQLKDQRSLSFRENAGSSLMHGLKHTAKAAGGIGKAGTKFFKQTKSAHGYSDYQGDLVQFYQPTVINQPLREQTRATRIAKRLEDSKDKTEFWMPALPWRCIDYLNFTGCEVEGLYRIPGSSREVMMWKQRFDQEYDVNLLEQNDLYDVNTIGSLFKAWLRELPEEIFPLKSQDRLAEKYNTQERAPDELREVLSELSPWNYYLLFAITCHLSLLHAYQDKNKMTFHNLYVCFAPALRMNNDCFRWLVADWRNCWKGCVTEAEALKDEYRILDGGSPDSTSTESDKEAEDVNRNGNAGPQLSKAGSDSAESQAFSPAKTRNRAGKEPKPIKVSSPSRSKDDSEISTSREPRTYDHNGLAPNTPSHNRSASQLPELSFPQPISPIFPNNT